MKHDSTAESVCQSSHALYIYPISSAGLTNDNTTDAVNVTGRPLSGALWDESSFTRVITVIRPTDCNFRTEGYHAVRNKTK